MEKPFDPIESLQIIQQTIDEAKMRFQENGVIYIFWGAVVAFCAIGQFILELYFVPYAFLIWLLTLLGSAFTFIYYYRKRKEAGRGRNIISTIVGTTGFIIGANIFILGFGFWPYLGIAFTPVVIIFLSLYGMIIGRALQFNPMFYMALVTNVLGFVLFFVDLQYHPLGTALTAICLLLVPGLILFNKHKHQ